MLGLIFGALLMRQWLFRQRAVAAADDTITSMSPAPPVITTVDILLEEETAEPSDLVSDLQVEPPSLEPQEKDIGSPDEQEKHPGS
jgi:hypothetical protein